MFLIRCPSCGERAQVEYRYVGDAWRTRPDELEVADEATWFDYVYIRDNPRGAHREYWQHVGGCRQFVKVIRDTVTHEILGTYLPSEEPNG